MKTSTRSMTIDEQYFQKPISVHTPIKSECPPKQTLELGGVSSGVGPLFTTTSFWDKLENNWVVVFAGAAIVAGVFAFVIYKKRQTSQSVQAEKADSSIEQNASVTHSQQKQEASKNETYLNPVSNTPSTLEEHIENVNDDVFTPTRYY